MSLQMDIKNYKILCLMDLNGEVPKFTSSAEM